MNEDEDNVLISYYSQSYEDVDMITIKYVDNVIKKGFNGVYADYNNDFNGLDSVLKEYCQNKCHYNIGIHNLYKNRPAYVDSKCFFGGSFNLSLIHSLIKEHGGYFRAYKTNPNISIKIGNDSMKFNISQINYDNFKRAVPKDPMNKKLIQIANDVVAEYHMYDMVEGE